MSTATSALLDLTAADLMSRDVVTIPQRLPVRAAAGLLRRARVTGAPIVDDDGRCVGVLSAVDFLRWVEGGPEAGRCPGSSCPYQTVGRLLSGDDAVVCGLVGGKCPLQEVRPMTGGRHSTICLRPLPSGAALQQIARLPLDAVGRFMTADVVSVGPRTPLAELARMMVDAHIHRVTVLDEQGRPVGIVSSTDVLAAVTHANLCRTAARRDDATAATRPPHRTESVALVPPGVGFSESFRPQ